MNEVRLRDALLLLTNTMVSISNTSGLDEVGR